MIICTACGARNGDSESFCGECGAYLEWEGEREAPAVVEAAPDLAPEQAEQAPGLVQRMKTAVGLSSEGEEQRQPPAQAAVVPPDGVASTPVPASPEHAAQQAGSAPTPGHASPPAPVLPGAAAPKPRRRELPPEDRKPAPGETICGHCGAGNAPTRKFCRRCGTDLVDAPVAARLPWWRRMFRSRAARDPVAGARPARKARKARKGHRGLVAVAVLVALLVGAGWLARGPLSRAYDSAVDRLQGTKVVNPTSFRASTSAPTHEAAQVRDGAPNRYWAPDAANKPRGQWIQLGFNSPFRLVYLRVFDGASDQLAEYLAQASPHVLRLTILRTHGRTSTKDVTLNDKPGSQSVHLAVDDVVGVRVTIETVYRYAPGKLAAIGEVEFLGRA